MKCPYCSKEMADGYISNWRNPVQWLPEGSRAPTFVYKKAKNGVTLYQKKASAWTGYSAETFYCETCHIVLAKTYTW